jgi:predicted phosphodiesterase
MTNAEKVIIALTKRNTRLKFAELAEAAKLTKRQLNDCIAEVRKVRPDLMFGKFDKCYWFSNTPTWYTNQTDLSKELPSEGVFGALSDTHLCSVAERLDLVNEAYNAFAERGVTKVFHTGDLTDGWQEYRNHISFVKVHGSQEQALYAIKNYPRRQGIKTYVIGGNHDDDYAKTKVDRLSLITHGFHHQGKEIKGRDDIVYVGQYSHYVIFPQEVRMHLVHPRGNNAYAMSYKQQKRSEAMSKNERPDMQLSGHFHTFTHIWLDGTHMVALPGLQDATEFFIRLGLPRSLGWTIISYKIVKGKLESFSPELFMRE